MENKEIKIKWSGRRLLLNIGKLLLDAAKLCFVSLVLGTVIKGDVEHATLLTSGIIASATAAVFGLIIISILEEK